jgi:hypothetical protein
MKGSRDGLITETYFNRMVKLGKLKVIKQFHGDRLVVGTWSDGRKARLLISRQTNLPK